MVLEGLSLQNLRFCSAKVWQTLISKHKAPAQRLTSSLTSLLSQRCLYDLPPLTIPSYQVAPQYTLTAVLCPAFSLALTTVYSHLVCVFVWSLFPLPPSELYL